MDLVVYIHGVSPDLDLVTITPEYIRGEVPPDPERRKRIGHARQYEAFHDGVARQLGDPGRLASWRDASLCKAEWGWESFDTDAALGKSHRLIDAEYHLGRRALEVMRRRGPWGRLQAPLRETFLYGLADVFYYLSADGRRSIRRRIAEQIADALDDATDGSDEEVTCTLVGHSAGSAIALDIFSDFRAGREFVGDPQALRDEERSLERQCARFEAQLERRGEPLTKMKAGAFDSLAALRRLRSLLDLVDDRRLRFERLITLGSPNTLLALRSDEAINALAYGEPMSPSLLGFADEDSTDAAGGGPRWINIWDIRDPVSYPVEPLLSETPRVRDVHVAAAPWFFWRSHTGYWTSRAAHRAVAEHF